MATKFTDAQVASYIQNNALSGAGLQQAAQAFQLAPDQLARAQSLLSSGDASVAAAGNAYNQQVANRPDLVAQNLATYNPATGLGSLVAAPANVGINQTQNVNSSGTAVSTLPAAINATTTTGIGGPLTPAVAANLMQRAMTTGVSTSEFDKYGGYNAVQALYNASGGSYNPGDFDKTFLQNAATQVANTGVGNLLSLAATNTPLTAAGITAMQNNGIGALNVADNTRRYSDPANLAIENAKYLQDQKDLRARIEREKITNPQTLTPLYQGLTAQSTPAAIAAAYAQFASGAGGDTATNQKEAVARLQKLGIPDSVIRQGYNFYLGLPTTAAAATTAATGATTTPVTGAITGAATNAATGATEPLYKGLTANSTSDDIARAYYQLASGAGGDTQTNQQEAVAFLQKLGISDPLIQSGYKDYREMADLKSKFGVTDGAAKPTAEGIISGFKYANDSGISEKDMEQVLGKDVFNTYKTGLADYAKTGITGILADKKLSFDEAVETVKFGRALGYDTQKLADLTGTDKKVFDAIYKNYEENVPKVIASAIKESPDVKDSDDQIIRAMALGQKYGFSDDDFAKALGFTTQQVKSALDPVRNYGTEINKVLSSTDSTLADTKKIIESGRNNGAINKLFGTNLNTLDTKIAEIEDRWKGFEGVDPMHAQRVYDQIGQQREKLGDKYYRGVFGDPKIMAATLARKGIDTLADIGQKDKYEAAPAEKRYTTKDGAPLEDLGNGTFATNDGSVVPKNQVKTVYGYTEQELREGPEGGYYESKFVPLSGKDVDKEGNYQKLVGKVAIDKDTGKEISDIDGRIASQSSSGGLKKKFNTLNVNFTKDGVPVVTAASERAGLGGLAQDLAPMISMALPFMLPGLGSALSGMLPGAGVAASGATAAIAPTLMNQALTQGIISGGLTTLGGGQFEKGFLSGAVNPVINTGISNLLPANLVNTDIGRSITGAGSNVIKGALQGGNAKDLLGQGILSGLTNYGLGEATKGLNLTPQQLNFATGIVAPLLQGQKINPITALGALANVGQQQTKKDNSNIDFGGGGSDSDELLGGAGVDDNRDFGNPGYNQSVDQQSLNNTFTGSGPSNFYGANMAGNSKDQSLIAQLSQMISQGAPLGGGYIKPARVGSGYGAKWSKKFNEGGMVNASQKMQRTTS